MSSVVPQAVSPPVLLDFSAEGVATLTLNRPHARNAYNGETVREFARLLDHIEASAVIRAVVLRGAGDHFCAGADFSWMRETGRASRDDNEADARAIAQMFLKLSEMPQPTIALVHGACLGGAMGLAAACDICLATETAFFGLTEVRVGLVPYIVGPYVVRAIGAREAARLFVTGERLTAQDARRIGLVHDTAADSEALNEFRDKTLAGVLAAAPGAVRASKRLARILSSRTLDATLSSEMAEYAASGRTQAEAIEGMTAFLDKRPPAWAQRAKAGVR